jgi:predicted solute-binding protein
MGVGGDILKGIAKEATRDITKEFDEALIESMKERKRNEAALAASKSAKDRGLSVEEAEEEIDSAIEVADQEMEKSQKKANIFFTVIGVLLTAIMWAYIFSQ